MDNIYRFPGRMLLVLISWPRLSRLYGRIMRLQRPRFLAQWMIRHFQKHYRIAMDEFQGTAADYPSLSEFFLRPFDPETRPLAGSADCLLSPADGRLIELELIERDCATQVKGWNYPMSLLLAERSRLCQKMVCRNDLSFTQQLPSLPLPALHPHQRLLPRRHAPFPGQ